MTKIGRRDFLAGMALSAAAAATAAACSEGGGRRASGLSVGSGAPDRIGGLESPALRPIELTAFRPAGWLERQLRIQASGLTGHLDEFWPDVQDSRWFGGRAEGWERAPYWLDGAIPLAWLVGDEPLQRRIAGYIDHIVTHQREDGWYGTHDVDARNPDFSKPYDIWAFFLANKMLVQYHSIAGDDRVLEAVESNLRMLGRFLERQPLFDWGRFRWFEGLVAIYYLYERDPRPWLLELARRLHDQGFDYAEFYRGEDVTVPTPRRGLWRWDKHVVNTGMALKAGPLWARLSGRESDRRAAGDMLEILDRYHGQVTGMFTGDECLAGKNPVQGTELCAVVEAMYSLELLTSITGDPAFADRLERVAFNALPATFSPDMWAHQYDQQVNQAQCTINPQHLWTTNGPESNLYGLEPNYGCCTANMHQGWPKFASHLWMRTADEGLAAAAYAPGEVRFKSGGVPVTVSLATDYPFRETLEFTVKTEQPARFPLVLRIPAWAEGAEIRIEGNREGTPRPGIFHRVERDWSGESRLTLTLPMRARTSRRYNGALSVERGPLVYALQPEEKWSRVNADKPHRELPHADWEVRPTTPWNYGLLVDEGDPGRSIRFEERPVGEKPFSPKGAGMSATVRGRRLPGWKLRFGWAGEIRPEAQESEEPLEDVTLIPYGCTNLRIGEFPRLKK